MKTRNWLSSVVLILTLGFAAKGEAQTNIARTGRFYRGTGTNSTYHSFVIPLDFQKGVPLGEMGDGSTNLFPVNHDTQYHYNATNPASATNLGLRIPYKSPIVAFGSRVGGSPLFHNQSYRFGVYAGETGPGYLSSGALYIRVYRQSDFGFVTQFAVPIPSLEQTNEWRQFLTNGYTTTVTNCGLTTSVRFNDPYKMWGTTLAGRYHITHTAEPTQTNYVYHVMLAGYVNANWMSCLGSGHTNRAWSFLYTLEFQPRPPWRALFLDQPQFSGVPAPSFYAGASLPELLTNAPPVTNTVSLSPTACTNLDASPELRRHPTLDQFVSDMRRNPLALANYVQNEVELTDALAYNDNGSVSDISINLGGVNRSALGTFMEKQGSPTEQCALLIYLLRQAGVPAVYVFPAENGLKMLDTQLSALLRMQIRGAVNNSVGASAQPWTTNNLIPVNYPWVAAYIGTNWVHLFPWFKDTEVVEGLNLYDFMSASYKTSYSWISDYLYGKTNITSMSTEDDTPQTLFPLFIKQALAANAPGISLDDIGVRYRNRRHSYTRWNDFPRPLVVTNVSIAIESLGSTAITNVNPRLTNIFDTVSVTVSSVANPLTKLTTGTLRVADLHNRKLLIRHEKITSKSHRMILSLEPYRPDVSGVGAFTDDAALLKQQAITNTLGSSDDLLAVQFVYQRQRSLPVGFVVPDHDASFLGLSATTSITNNRPLRKGDLAAICMNVGRVTPQMLQVRAQELWNMENTLKGNPSATNTLSPDVYQGAVAYLMGMAYFEKVGRFDMLNRRLHKVQVASQLAFGLSSIRAARVNNALPSGNIDLVQPSIDMFYKEVAIAGNTTIRLDSGDDGMVPNDDYFHLFIADGSAQEHSIINHFFNQTDAVSTMKLLQVAQAKSATNGQPGILVLDYTNHVAEGNKNYPTGGTTMLKDQSPPIWASVTNAFASYTYPFANYVQVLITPGPVTNQTQSFKGMAALILQPSGATAAIAEKNGSYGANNPAGSLALANTPNLWLGVDADNNYSMNLTAPSASSITLAPDAYASYGAGSVANYADLNYYAYSGFQSAWTSDSMDYLGLGSLGALNLNYSQSVEAANGNQGWLGQLTDALGQALSHVADPVHAVTGEFYISATDIVLPGPMPLAISRNYSSLNLADNQFGYGWKFNFMPYLSLNADATLVYAAEADGAVLAYEQTATNANVYLPTPAKNPQLNNNSTAGIGSTANRLQNRITKQTVGSDTYYYLTQADGGKRSFKVMTFAGTVNRTRPYLTRWEDHRGNAFTFEYGTNSAASDFAEVRRVQSSNGNFLGLRYDVYGHITEAWTGDGRRLSYAYDQFGDLVNVTLPDQSVIGYDYEHKTQAVTNGSVVTQVPYSTHLVLKENKPDGRTLKNEYDPHRRVTNQWSTVGPDLNLVRNATFIYANNFNLTNSFTNTITGYTLVKDVFNQTTRYEYTNGLITRIVDPLNQTIEQQWYADSAAPPGYPRSLWKQKDKRGLWTEFKYDPRGNVTNTVTWGDLTGDGTTQYATNTMAYGTNNLPVETTDPVGNKVLTQYHPQFPFLPESIIRQAGATLVSTNKRVYYSVTNTFVSGGVTYTNLALGLLQREIRAFNSPDAATNDFSHDGRGFVTRTIRYTGTSDPAVTNTFFYNDRGELVEQTDADGRMVRLDRDPMGRPTAREVYEAGQVVPLAWDYTYYNENGEVTWTDGPRYNPEDYVWRDYDGAGRQTTEIRWRSRARADGTGVEAAPDAELYAQTFQQFDAFGNLIRVVNPRGVITTNTWDAIGQLVSRKVLETNGTVLTAEGFAYEPGGLVTRHTNALGGLTETLYTSTGQPRYRKDADGATSAWRYYRDGRIHLEIQRNGAYWETTYDDALRKTTRVFRNSGGTALATNLTLFDRRGNAIVTTDAAGCSFTNTFDGLDRLKSTVGPTTMTIVPSGSDPLSLNFVTNYAQQLTMRIYDASGKVLTVTNALGDKTISTSDALGRTVKVEVRDASNRLVRVTTTGYSADHHGVTVTNGSGSSAIVSASFTDNNGSPVLSVAYPSANNREFTLRAYDWVGNLTFEGRYSASGSVVSSHSGVWQWYDSLNRVSLRMELDGALTGFSYDGLGNVTNRSMPNDLQWQATYNCAGQILTENDRNGAQTTRSTVYSYYPAGNAWAGLLKTVTDGRNVTRTNSYDQFLRVATVTTTGPQAEQQMTLAWNYDVRGLLTNATLAFASTNGGPATRIERRYNAYTLLTSDFGFADNVELTYLGQGWDVAGRRTAIGGMGFQYRADGLMSGMNGGTFGYGDNGLLTGRTNAFRSLTVNQRDGVGRLLQTTTRVGTSTALTESWAWTGDGLPTTYTATRSDFTDTRRFGYGAYHRRLTNESLTLASGQTATNFYTFDNGTAGGLGVLTKAGPTAASAAWTSGADAFSRISAETNTVLHRTALGTVNGPARLSGNVNGRPVDFRYNRSAAGQWSAALELLPGTNTLTVYAEHPSTQFTTNQVSTFTVAGGAQDRVDSQFDPGGYVTNRVWKNSQGQTQRSQALVWDAFGRLVKVRERDANTNGFNWQADFDPLGRRLRTTTVPVTNGVALTAQPRTLVHYYDPAVEFLEIGVAVNGVTTWKNYGPDLDGRYGGQMGLGGLESLATGSTIVGIVQDGFGNVLGRANSGTVTWNAARSSLYGPVEGYPALSLSVGPLTSEHLAWRGKWRDETSLFYWGARPYDPARRNFLSVDPLGHGSDPGLYAAFNGNPAVYWDADGRFGKGWAEGWKESSSEPADSSLAFSLGMVMGGLQGEYYRGLGGGSSITANTLTFGGSDYTGLTDSSQYQGGAYTGSRILSTVGRESLITAATFGTAQLARGGSQGALYAYQGLQTFNAARSGYQIGTGIDQVSQGNNWGYLNIAGGTLGFVGSTTFAAGNPSLNSLGGVGPSSGGFAQGAVNWWNTGSAGDAAFQNLSFKQQLLSEIGQNSVSGTTTSGRYAAIGGDPASALEKGASILQGGNLSEIFGLNIPKTISLLGTGPSPGARLVIPPAAFISSGGINVVNSATSPGGYP